MRNYISKSIRERKKAHNAMIDRLAQEQIDKAENRPLNAVSGVIEGEGTVKNCFIRGKVRIAKGAVLVNSLIDEDVELELGAGTVVACCSFHAVLTGSTHLPIKITLKRSAMMVYVWAAASIEVGKRSKLVFVQVNDPGIQYNALAQDPITIGNDCYIIHSYLGAIGHIGEPNKTRLTIGDDAFIWLSKVGAEVGSISIGNGFTICSYTEGLMLSLGTRKIEVPKDVLEPRNPTSTLSNREYTNSLRSSYLNMTVGDGCYVGTGVAFSPAFEKIKDPTVTIGNNVSFINSKGSERTEHMYRYLVHTAKTGDNITFDVSHDSWVCYSKPIRNLSVGSGSTVVMNTTSETRFEGIDFTVPANSLTFL